MAAPTADTFDYVVVGSGAGGGTLAARLAEAGMKVLVLEAGADPEAPDIRASGLPEDYDVPAFHPFASENKAMAWNFMVHDFGDDAERRSRPADDPPPGALYPRASTLGGCTAHNAMILMAPHDSDWNAIAELTGDELWRAGNMRCYFERIEDCRYRPWRRLLALATGGRLNPSGHGWNGWLSAERPLPARAFADIALMSVIWEAVRADLFGAPRTAFARAISGLRRVVERLARIAIGEDDPNDQRAGGLFGEGLTKVPLSTSDGRRRGARERVHAAVREHGLRVEYDALATRVVFDADNRAVGVEYLKGRNLYRAAPETSRLDGEPRRVEARHEVILAGGAFNTPQLLMLSGVGPKDRLAALGVELRFALEGVGRNLQDRYEIGVIHKAARPWACLEGARLAVGDPVYREWLRGRGMYVTNGAAIAFSLRSKVARDNPDLFVMALLTRFSGYFPGYSDIIRASRDDLTFSVLKAHTNNRGGTVSLASADPRDPPHIDFNYFEEGTDASGDDLKAVVDGVRRVRDMTAALTRLGVIRAEDTPGAGLADDAALERFIRANAWGHHASCTCPIGPIGRGGVLDADFKVHGTRSLRVVDASVFPRIPGFFIVCAIYMIAEKAADVILAAASSARQ